MLEKVREDLSCTEGGTAEVRKEPRGQQEQRCSVKLLVFAVEYAFVRGQRRGRN